MKRDMPLIRDPKGFREGVVDFSIFTNAFEQRINFSDLDGIAERHGNFLVIEKKQSKKIPLGQMYLLKRLHSLGVFTIIVFAGSEYDPKLMLLIRPEDDFELKWQPCNREKLVHVVQEWWKKV
jgi:hypothetical protein